MKLRDINPNWLTSVGELMITNIQHELQFHAHIYAKFMHIYGQNRLYFNK